MIAFLVLETLMIGVFCALDIVLFYIFFEGRPDPDVHHHRCLGRQARRLCGVQVLPLHAAGSVLMLLAIMAMYWDAGTTDIRQLLAHNFPAECRPGCGWPSSPRLR
jgi:NADH-quinone oxidoreductase subunit M